MLNYNKDGRAACIKFIANYIREYYPTKEEQESAKLGITVKQLRKIKEQEMIKKVAVKARVNLKWRNHLQERLILNDDELVRAINTTLEIIEQALSKDKTIRIRDVGDFFPVQKKLKDILIKDICFNPEPEWIRRLNKEDEPKSLLKGIKRKLSREAETEEFS